MSDIKIIRKVAVIFVTDVVGFSKLMEYNEDATMQSLNSCRKILEKLFEEHGGRIFNTAGDSVLAEFQSAVSAVICATEFQKLIKQRNLSVSKDSMMEFRIGLNMGEVIVEGNNLYGDGVNIAARLEAFSQPGGVSLSKAVHDTVSQKVELSFSDLGTQQVKNTVLHAYDIGIDGLQQREQSLVNMQSDTATESKPPCIAVIPFKVMGNDEDQEYFADGVTEDIISNLSSWKSFPVISRNSSFSFKGQDIKTSDIAKELGANYIVEGSIRKGGNKVRITASLVDATDEQQVWSKRWDRSLDDIFEVQDEVSQDVAALIVPALKGKEHERIKSKPPTSFSAWDSYLKALAIFNDDDAEDHETIMKLCNDAIEKDEKLTDAYVLKSRCIYNRIFSSEFGNERIENEKLFHEFANKAFAIDPNNPEAVSAFSRSFNLKKNYDQRMKYAKQALDLNPSHAGSNFDYGLALCNDANFSGAEAYIQKAIELDPLGRKKYEGFLGILYIAMQDSKQALIWINILYDRTQHSRYDGFRAAIYAHSGDTKTAKEYLEKFLTSRPEIRCIEDYMKVAPTICADYLETGLRKIW